MRWYAVPYATQKSRYHIIFCLSIVFVELSVLHTRFPQRPFIKDSNFNTSEITNREKQQKEKINTNWKCWNQIREEQKKICYLGISLTLLFFPSNWGCRTMPSTETMRCMNVLKWKDRDTQRDIARKRHERGAPTLPFTSSIQYGYGYMNGKCS